MDVVTDLSHYFQLGLSETPAEFLAWREAWLGGPGSVRVQENTRSGGWDVVVRLDGTYSDREEAEEAARCFRQEIPGLVEQIRTGKMNEHLT